MRLAVVGLGRIGQYHANHAQQVAQETGGVLTAVVDTNAERAKETAARLSRTQATPVEPFFSVEEIAAAGVADGSFVCSPTDCHRSNTTVLIRAGQRVLLEKPLTGTLADDREFAQQLDREFPNSVMLAFQRRYDAPLQHAKQLMKDGAIGRVFKIVSILEDSNPAPDGYNSGGILPDMSVHNVDEILWLCDGKMPVSATAIGSCLHSRKLSTAIEDFDDAYMHLWFEGELGAQVQVSRNHVSGYRVESWLFGETGQIHIGRFEQRYRDVVVEVYGKRPATQPIEVKTYSMPEYGAGAPEFMDRFGPAYKAELTEFVRKCESGEPFAVTHRDGVRAMEVIDAAMRGLIDPAKCATVTSVIR
ncbi:MAG: Gfo/Idh/MocA family oxidoreductase [Acidobacteria bacterium]|nr:Gfo/Idh/MocA family oxidoreductase [Acidobacteriota bacterium]